VRTALLAGATGLVGRALLSLLLERPEYGRVEVLARRPLDEAATSGLKRRVHIVDFTALQAVPAVDDVCIALGTTIRVAGSPAAFRAVDHDLVVAIARAARAAGASRLAVVSALGADAGSRVFYNRVKGEMEAAVATLGFATLVIARPSLLLGDRAALGQPLRPGEVWAARLSRPLATLLPARIRPIEAERVARSMIDALTAAAPGVRVLSSAEMQSASPP
jgi:uncharacterized protein YbjT (DUF2867 family)